MERPRPSADDLYAIASRGEAGIATMDPGASGALPAVRRKRARFTIFRFAARL